MDRLPLLEGLWGDTRSLDYSSFRLLSDAWELACEQLVGGQAGCGADVRRCGLWSHFVGVSQT